MVFPNLVQGQQTDPPDAGSFRFRTGVELINVTATVTDTRGRFVSGLEKADFLLYEDDTLQDAMSLMTENHITGLPVANSKSVCIGVISATDILTYEQDHSEFAAEANSDLARYYDPDTERWESVRLTSFALEEFAEVKVSQVMSREVVSVGPQTTLDEVARAMVGDNIHRVLVLDETQHLLGIISSFDFVRLFAARK